MKTKRWKKPDFKMPKHFWLDEADPDEGDPETEPLEEHIILNRSEPAGGHQKVGTLYCGPFTGH